MAKIVCVGLACLDYLFKIETLPKGGGKFFATDYAAAPGGPAAAASLAVAALGHEAIFLGRLGGDEIGDTIVAQMKKRGVNTDFIRRIENRSSQVSSVVVEPDRQLFILATGSGPVLAAPGCGCPGRRSARGCPMAPGCGKSTENSIKT